MSRRPKPLGLKLLEGSRVRHPGERAAMRAGGPPPAADADLSVPHHLRGVARAAWSTYAKHMAEQKTFTARDRMLLEVLVETYAESREARATVAKEGQTVTVGGSVRVHPSMRVIADAEKRLRLLLIECGLTPASRSRVATAEANPDEDDTFLKLRRRP